MSTGDDRTTSTATLDSMAVLLGRGGDHTVREIAQQPGLWRQVGRDVTGWVPGHPALRELLDRRDLRIILTGAGTSAFAGQVIAPALQRSRRGRVDAIATTDLIADPQAAFAEDVPTLVVSFARSGDSPESVAATELADQLLERCHHLVVTCNPDGHLARSRSDDDRSHVLLMPLEANDRGFAMTSSFTCMLLAARLVLDATLDPTSTSEQLATNAETEFASRVTDTAKLATRRAQRIVYLGSGSSTGLARESALKVLELTAGEVAALADSSLGFRHGPKSFLTEDTLALLYVSADPYTRRYDLDMLHELRRALPPEQVIAVGDVDASSGPAWPVGGLDRLDDGLRGVPAVLGAQLLALQTSLELGLTPDNPFPSGQVNRVVQGVTVHPLEAP